MYDFSSWTPDIIVIGEGTNDCSGNAPPDIFKKKLIELLDFLNERYKTQPIIWFYGMMNDGYKNYIIEAINEFNNKIGEKRVHTIFFEHLEDDEVGGNYHPNAKAHIKYAKVIGDKIKELLNW